MRVSLALLLGFCIILLGEADEGERGTAARKKGETDAPGAAGDANENFGQDAIPEKTFTLEELHRYDGKELGLPVYVAVKGMVFDVTAGAAKFYGPGKPYSKFAGRDITRNTAMFSTLEKDLDRRDYPPEKQAALDKSYENTYMRKYSIVGTLLHYEYEVPEEEGAKEVGAGDGRVWDKEKQRFVSPPKAGSGMAWNMVDFSSMCGYVKDSLGRLSPLMKSLGMARTTPPPPAEL